MFDDSIGIVTVHAETMVSANTVMSTVRIKGKIEGEKQRAKCKDIPLKS